MTDGRHDEDREPDSRPNDPVEPAADQNRPDAQPEPAAPLDFDPYRFGRPEHPVPPEYAPPGYVPPAEATPPPAQWPPTQWPPTPQQPGYAAYPPPAAGQPGQPSAPPPPYQGSPNQGSPNQGNPYQGSPYQGSPYQGSPYQGSPYQGSPYQGSPYQGAPLPPPGYQYGTARTGNTKATVALVLGILSIVFCWLSILDLVLIVPAIVLGALARGDAKRFPHRGGRGPATVGLVCGLVGIVFAASLTIFYYTRVKTCIDNFDMNSAAYNHCVHQKL